MNISTIFLLLAIVLPVVLFVGQPLTGHRRRQESKHELSTLLAERDRLLNVLQELDFDYNLGKIPSEDYPSQRAALVQEGAAILRKLDELAPAAKPGESREMVEDRLEERIADRRAAKLQKSGSASISDEELEERIAQRRNSLKEKVSGFCPQCGKPIIPADVFCPSCGERLR